MSWSGCSATSGSRLFMSIRMAASCGQPRQLSVVPRGARTGRAPAAGEPAESTETMTTPRRAGSPGGGDHPPPFIIILCRTLIIIPPCPAGPVAFSARAHRCVRSTPGRDALVCRRCDNRHERMSWLPQGCGSFGVRVLGGEFEGGLVAVEVVALVFLGDVVVPVGVEIAAGVEGA